MWMELTVAKFKFYPDNCLEGLRKSEKSLNQYNWCSSRVSSRKPREYKSEELLLVFKVACLIIISSLSLPRDIGCSDTFTWYC
jgi:hypothetical protein